jgi:hypothetical protein
MYPPLNTRDLGLAKAMDARVAVAGAEVGLTGMHFAHDHAERTPD